MQKQNNLMFHVRSTVRAGEMREYEREISVDLTGNARPKCNHTRTSKCCQINNLQLMITDESSSTTLALYGLLGLLKKLILPTAIALRKTKYLKVKKKRLVKLS